MKNKYLGLKIGILVFGSFVLMLALWYFFFYREPSAVVGVLASISAIIMYVGLFVPLFFPPSDTKKTGKVFVGGAIYYRGYITYAIACIVITTLLKLRIIFPIPAMIAYGVVLFIFAIYFFLTCLTTSHVADVKEYEEQKIATIQMLRDQTRILAAMNAQIGDEHREIRDMIQQISEDMRYLAPTDNHTAIQLENQMLRLVQDIAQDPFFTNMGNMSDVNVKGKLSNVQALYRQRKTIF